MDPVSKKHSSGVALVFILMALIAVLALAVVFLSRIGRNEAVAEPQPAQATLVTTGTEELEVIEAPRVDQPTTDTEATQTPMPKAVIPPPPPPPVGTPDSSSLPPEG